MWVEFHHFSKLLGCCFPGYWCCSSVKQDKQTVKSKDKLQKTKQGQHKYYRLCAAVNKQHSGSSSPVFGTLL